MIFFRNFDVTMFPRWLGTTLFVGVLSACSSVPESTREEADVSASVSSALVVDDGLSEAFAAFQKQFVLDGQDQNFQMAFGPHPVLVNEPSTAGVTGRATFHFAQGQVEAQLHGDALAGKSFDLWLVHNVEGSGRTVRPEVGDQSLRVGSFQATPDLTQQTLTATLSQANVRFDFDQLVVTLAGKRPEASVAAIGARTLFEKRFFRAAFAQPTPAVTGTLSTEIETTDPLVQRGAQLFFKETFNGNGRTCGTCHRAEHNLTLDAAFIATLPATDPLFVAETNPALAQLENPSKMHTFGVIQENLDGFNAPPVMRGVPHLLAQSTSLRPQIGGTLGIPGSPPDQATAWSGDGAPGRGTLQEFALGAIAQHLTRTLARTAGVDFRVPTQAESDALEAFTLFNGRQSDPDLSTLQMRDAHAESGRNLFNGNAFCSFCHSNGGANTAANINLVFPTGVADRTFAQQFPQDGGFGRTPSSHGLGTGAFNAPSVIEAADTLPAFHLSDIQSIEDAVNFYTTDQFNLSAAGRIIVAIHLQPQEVADIAAFLRAVNAAENVREVRKRIQFVHDHRSAGNTQILTVAMADMDDALRVLTEKDLNPTARHYLATAKQATIIAQANPDANRPAYLDTVLVNLQGAKDDLFASNPASQF